MAILVNNQFIKKFTSKFFQEILTLPRVLKRLIVLSFDIFFCAISTWIAFALRFDKFVSFEILFSKSSIISIIILIPIFSLFGLYKTIFRYSNLSTLRILFIAISIYTILYFLIISIVKISITPRSIGIIQPIILLFFMSIYRVGFGEILRNLQKTNHNKLKKQTILIYGAGQAGKYIAERIELDQNTKLIGFIDDNSNLHNQTINGVKIYSPDNLSTLIENNNISAVLLAISNISRFRRNIIIEMLSNLKIQVRTLPNLIDFARGSIKFNEIKELDIDDLLGRDIVQPNLNLLKEKVESKIVLVTGAGGSIGSELSRQLLSLLPKFLIIIDKNEFNLYQIQSELESIQDIKKEFDVKIIPLIGDINDYNFLKRLFIKWKVDLVYHAAAYKHVPIVEHNIINSLVNNTFGTKLLAEISMNYKVKNFIFISTDKAVRPKNIMGATKRLSEICLQSLQSNQNSKNKTLFTMVRFGNVLDSSGSVIPKFRKQIQNGGPITLTHKDINRYFMTIEEAAQLVLQSVSLSTGGEVFVLDMGKPIRIYDLAIKMINLSGLSVRDPQSNPRGDIEIKITGLRPGEKLYEELFLGNNPQNTEHPKIQKVSEDFIKWEKLEKELEILKEQINSNDIPSIIFTLKKLVKEFNPSQKIVDHLYN